MIIVNRIFDFVPPLCLRFSQWFFLENSYFLAIFLSFALRLLVESQSFSL